MPDALDSFLADIDRTKLRIIRPSKVVFLCGGAKANEAHLPPQNLRDYLLRTRNIEDKISADFVLAESAQTLYRDTTYSDLIVFEEDIARISGIVLVISESAGSLAELGAFSSNDTIRPTLRIIISEDKFDQESFVRFGPVQRIKNLGDERVGVFPWRSHKKGHIVQNSVAPIFKDIKDFISGQVDGLANSFLYSGLNESRAFYDIFWLTHLANVIAPNTLYEAVNRIHPNLSHDDIRNHIFCMKVAGWMDKVSYSNKEYYYCKKDIDIFEYAYRSSAKSKDSIRRKLEISTLFKNTDNPPTAVYKRAMTARSGTKL